MWFLRLALDHIWGCSWGHVCLIWLQFSDNVGMILLSIWYSHKKKVEVNQFTKNSSFQVYENLWITLYILGVYMFTCYMPGSMRSFLSAWKWYISRNSFIVTGQAKNLATERDSLGQPKSGTRQARTGRDRPGQPKSGTRRKTKWDRAKKKTFKIGKGWPKTEKEVLKQERM